MKLYIYREELSGTLTLLSHCEPGGYLARGAFARKRRWVTEETAKGNAVGVNNDGTILVFSPHPIPQD